MCSAVTLPHMFLVSSYFLFQAESSAPPPPHPLLIYINSKWGNSQIQLQHEWRLLTKLNAQWCSLLSVPRDKVD